MNRRCVNWLAKLTHTCNTEINPSWLWYMILLIYCQMYFINSFLRNFASMLLNIWSCNFLSFLVWFWYQDTGSLVEWIWECYTLFRFLELFEKPRYWSLVWFVLFFSLVFCLFGWFLVLGFLFLFCFVLFCLYFLGPQPWRMKVPRLGV